MRLVLLVLSLSGCCLFNNGLRTASDRCQADYDTCLDVCGRGIPSSWDLLSGLTVASCVQHCNEQSTTCRPSLAMPALTPVASPAARADGGRRPTPSPSATCLPPFELVCDASAQDTTRADGP
jgi:hypothetical protein